MHRCFAATGVHCTAEGLLSATQSRRGFPTWPLPTKVSRPRCATWYFSCWIWDVILFFGQSLSAVSDPQKSMNHHKGAYVEVVHSNIQLDVHICRCRGWGKRTVYSFNNFQQIYYMLYIYIYSIYCKQTTSASKKLMQDCKTQLVNANVWSLFPFLVWSTH